MKKKVTGLLVYLFVYIIAATAGILFYNLFEGHMDVLLNIFLCDVIATVVVFISSLILRSASIYDPYWSVQTAVIYIALMIKFGRFELGNMLFLVFILFWAIRLTVNFIIHFSDMSYIDWRYRMLKEKSKFFYPIVNLLGIEMFPTCVVYLASIPAFLYVINGSAFHWTQIFGLLVMATGTLLEIFSDHEMIKFMEVRSSNKEIIRLGLWKHSRHPNYLGEITFWFGVALVYFTPLCKEWQVFVGALVNLLMFVLISIPMAENHMREYKPGFDKYVEETRMLLPIKRFNFRKK